MATITHVGLALPKYHYPPQEILELTKNWVMESPEQRGLFERFLKSSQVGGRYFCLPVEKILELSSQEQRAEIFTREAKALSVNAVQTCIISSNINKSAVRELIFSSCSMPTIPSIDASVVNEMGLASTIRRTPLFQHGCAGGTVGLSMACRNFDVQGGGVSLVLSTELCSLVFQVSDFSTGSLVGSALFGDGSACAVVQNEGSGLEYLASLSYLVPNSEIVMGYDIRNDGSHLRLQRELPMILSQQLPPLIRDFLECNRVNAADISAWLFHPGGVRILESLEQSFQLDRTATHWAWDVLACFGNMSSASILFVLANFLQNNTCKVGDKVLMVGVGPGLTLELLLFQYK